MMTELLLGLYPDIFKAGSSFAGMPAGCHGPNDNSSNAKDYNGSCAGDSSSIKYTPQQWGDLARAMDPGYTGHRPRLQLFHGSADSIINFVNMAWSCDQYIDLLNLSTNPTKTNTGLTLGTHQASEQQWNNACGYLVLDAFDSIGGDHGPSDALFVGKYVLPFLGLDSQTAVTSAVDPEIAQCGGDGGAPPTSDGGTDASKTDSGNGGSGGAGTTGAGGSAGGAGGSSVSTGGSNATGGSTGSGGKSGAGGASGTGGSQSSGGSQASGGEVSSGGKASTGGSAGSGSGGTPSSGGAAGNSTGGGGTNGCSCAVGRANGNGYVGIVLLALGLALTSVARRRRAKA
jgi:hypothetical protein